MKKEVYKIYLKYILLLLASETISGRVGLHAKGALVTSREIKIRKIYSSNAL